MTNNYNNEPMLEVYIFETTQLLEQLEQVIISSEKTNCYTPDAINEIFRVMHTIKGSSAMMLFNNISTLAHSVEDLFFLLREEKHQNLDYSQLTDLVLEGVDFIKVETEKIKNGDNADGNAEPIIINIKGFLEKLKQTGTSSDQMAAGGHEDEKNQKYYISRIKMPASAEMNAYKALIYFEEGCEMESIRAFTVIHNLKEIADEISYIPEDIIDNDSCDEIIKKEGFQVFFKSAQLYEKAEELLMQTVFLKDLELVQLGSCEEHNQLTGKPHVTFDEPPIKAPQYTEMENKYKDTQTQTHAANHQSIISVSVEKLDKLMDLMGEIVISEAMVTQNPDLKGLTLDSFQKAASHLRKITGELQDMVMSIRMVPLDATFQKMNRIVRDMNKKLNKEVYLKIIGEDTEVDKNIIEHISDPLMHLIRNAIDHGIEFPEERVAACKSREGTVTLEARNAGREVLVIIKDDGRGLDKDKILKRARENGLLHKLEGEMNDKEIYSLIFLPGFSTNDSVTEFSGRGVGMDVVVKNIEAVGGSVQIDSIRGEGTTVILKIPLTLAIIDGMNIRVGKSKYTIPTISIKESFRPKERDIIKDPDGNEMIMVRGQCYPILRLHELYNVKPDTACLHEGIIIMAEEENRTVCLFADELLGEQQVVVKALPDYIKSIRKVRGLAGCTLLGDGSISLILNIDGLLSA